MTEAWTRPAPENERTSKQISTELTKYFTKDEHEREHCDITDNNDLIVDMNGDNRDAILVIIVFVDDDDDLL